jgi:ribosomal protein L11 methyltransferase
VSGWDQFTVVAQEEDASLMSDAFIEMGALGLQIEDDQSLSVPEKPSSLTKRSKIIASFASSVENALDVQAQLNALIQDKQLQNTSVTFTHIPEQDYAKQFQQSWKAFQIGQSIWIVPSWEDATFVCNDKNAIVIHMDPELAFGTGQHETTRLCSEGILAAVRGSADKRALRVLDVGTGTGILAFVGVLAGAHSAVGTDIDPEALAVARANAAKNGLSDRVTFSDEDPDRLGEKFDVVVANILALPLIMLAQSIFAAIKPGGKLLLSGLLTTQVDDVARTYTALGLRDAKVQTLGDWAMVTFSKP